MKYKLGDKVKIRSDLEIGERYSRSVFTSKMLRLSGALVFLRY